jgi:hypothetical protein
VKRSGALSRGPGEPCDGSTSRASPPRTPLEPHRAKFVEFLKARREHALDIASNLDTLLLMEA